MLKYLNEKIDRAYRIGGLKFAFFTSISNFLRKIEGKLIYSINKLKYRNKKEILKKIYDFEMFLDVGCKGIQKQLIVNGDRETLAVETLRNELKKGDVVLEAGANIGYYVLLESKPIGDKGLIYAVEPSKENYSRLRKNIKHNKLKNIKTYNFAFSDKDEKGFLEVLPHSNMNRIIKEKSPLKNVEKVKITTIDNFLKNEKKPDVVRMDVEGDEYHILKGMEKLLEKNPPRLLYIETHFKHMGKEKSKEFLKKLRKWGYEIKYCFLYETSTSKIPFLNWLDKKRLEKVNNKLTINDLLKNNFHADYLASLEIFFEHKIKGKYLNNKKNKDKRWNKKKK